LAQVVAILNVQFVLAAELIHEIFGAMGFGPDQNISWKTLPFMVKLGCKAPMS
jgi:hypothetical protein